MTQRELLRTDPSSYVNDGDVLPRADLASLPDIVDDDYEEASSGEVGVSISLAKRAACLSEALDCYAAASKLDGILRSGRRDIINKYGGEAAIKTKIAHLLSKGKTALASGYGADEMLAGADNLLDAYGSPIDRQQIDDEVGTVVHPFRSAYTAHGARGKNLSAAEKTKKIAQTTRSRHQLRTVLNWQKS